MFDNKFKAKLRAGQPAFGFYLNFACPELVEFMGHAGYDYVLIDGEHFIFNMETVQSLARAAQLTGMTPVARVPKNDAELILLYLEAGVQGLVIPHVNTAEDAQAAVRAVKYHPLGKRGAGSRTRAANYGLTQSPAEYFEEANRQTMVLALVEEREGFQNLPEILKVEGIDCVSLGSGDLAMSMGLPGQMSHPDVQALIRQARSQVLASDKLLGITTNSAEGARKALGEGASYVTLSLGDLLTRTVRNFLHGARGDDN